MARKPAPKVPSATADGGAGELPAELDRQYYRQRYADMRRLPDAELERHFQTNGVKEGRQGSPAASRSSFFDLLKSVPSILEIGPFANPAVRGPNVKYFDVLSTEMLRRRALAHKLDADRCPHIDFVSVTGDLAVVAEQFDAVVSSHAIEHQPDLIEHLIGVARILKPGGRYSLAVPDKRYCFDHFIAESTIADVLDAGARKLRFHDIASVIQHIALTTHNDSVRHWNGEHGEPVYKSAPERIRDALNTSLHSPGVYIDTHAWQFVPASFREIMQTLFDLGFSPFRVMRVYPTIRDSIEFYAILEKATDNIAPLRDELPSGFDEALYLLANPDVAKAGVNAKQHFLSYGRREGRKLQP